MTKVNISGKKIFVSLKMAERSEAQSAKRSFASKKNLRNYFRVALLTFFDFASLSHFGLNLE